MQVKDLSEGAFKALDQACGGVFKSLQAFCLATQCQAHLSVQTHLEGLEHDEMKLYVQVVHGDETRDFAIAKLEGSAQLIGWDIYLHDRVDSARNYLDRANSKIEQASEGTGRQLQAQRMGGLEDVVPNQGDIPVLSTLH